VTHGLQAVAGRRILLLNWRDVGHPAAGGAEVYCVEVAERLAAAGAVVTLFTARHAGASRTELRRGVQVVRQGGTFGVYARAAAYLRRNRRDLDAVIDFQNGIPFFAPLFSGRRNAVVLVVHHVHQDQFLLHFPWPLSRVGQFLEGPVSRRVYSRRPLVAVSPSTRRDVRRRLRLRGPIHVVPNGLTRAGRRLDRRPAENPHVVVVSRLVTQKRFRLLIEAVHELRERWPGLRVDIAGDGPEREALQAQVASLGLQDRVRLHGYTSAAVRDELLSSAWLTVSPSQAEGWGLTVIEANAAGVPAVTFAVPGLRDSVIDGVTGWLVPDGERLSVGIDRALDRLSDPDEAAAFSTRCRAWAARFSWDSTAERLAAVAVGEIDRISSLPRSRRLPTDLATRVDAHPPDGSRPEVAVTALAGRIRRSDQWSASPDGVRLVLHGCDEAGAEVVLARLGEWHADRVGLATPVELLVGAAE
jgi:glycosyltransferase involved in cell wall biosynthesis